MAPTTRKVQPHILFKALGSPDRLELLQLFQQNGAMSAKNLSDLTGGTVGNVAYHVGQLREAGLLKATGTRRVRGATETFMVLNARGENALTLVAQARRFG